MKKFSDEEFSLIEDLINKIAKEDKDTKKQLNFSNEERSGSREVNYITETINWDISFKGEEFNFNFNKHFIDMNPEEKYEKSFGNKINKFFDSDVIQTPYDSHTYRLRLNFQDLRRHQKDGTYEISETYDDLRTKNKVPIVKGISLYIYCRNLPLNFYDEDQNDFYDENCVIYIQTNSIKDANKNMKDLFYKLIIKAINNKCVHIKKFKKKK